MQQDKGWLLPDEEECEPITRTTCNFPCLVSALTASQKLAGKIASSDYKTAGCCNFHKCKPVDKSLDRDDGTALQECKDDQKSEDSFTPLIQCPHTFKWLLNEWSLTKGYLHFSRSNGSMFANSVIMMSLLNVTTMDNEKLL